MQHGTIFGHGAYLGPDFTAQYLHRAGLAMLAILQPGSKADARGPGPSETRVQQNAYDPDTGTLVYTAGQAHALPNSRSSTQSISGTRPASAA